MHDIYMEAIFGTLHVAVYSNSIVYIIIVLYVGLEYINIK